MRVFGLHSATLAATCLLLLGGCGSVAFEHPISDDDSTVADERLIGYWELVPASVEEEEPGPGDLWPMIVVGRDVKVKNQLEAVALELEDGVVDVTRMRVRPTRIGDHRFLGLQNTDDEKEGWFVVWYELDDDDGLRIRLLEPDVFAKAVQEGELEGTVMRTESGDEVKPRNVRITSNTATVRAYVEKHTATCIQSKSLTLRRLVERGSDDMVELVGPGEPAPPGEPDEDSEGPDEEDDAEHDE